MAKFKDKLRAIFVGNAAVAAPRPQTDEERRQAADTETLAKFQAFDTAVGALPTQDTLSSRLRSALLNGHARVAKDSLEKGAPFVQTVCHSWFPGGRPVDTPVLGIAADNGWNDMFALLLPHSDANNLNAALKAAENRHNVSLARAVHDETARRGITPGAPEPDPMSLAAPIKISKPLQL